MIITKEMLNELIPKEQIPKRLDSALNLYTFIGRGNKKGLILYNVNPTTWNTLYPFYEQNHKFTLDNFYIDEQNLTYGKLINIFKKHYDDYYNNLEKTINKTKKDLLIEEYKKNFNLKKVRIATELNPCYELKYSKSKNVWTLYYFENYVTNYVDDINVLLNQKCYPQELLDIDAKIKEIKGIPIVSNLFYVLSLSDNIKKLNDNIINIKE